MLDDLAPGAVVGTGSNRRRIQLESLRPDLRIVGIRGNIATRLGRLEGDEPLDAIVMAAAALDRLELDGFVVDRLEPDLFIPQVGQGALPIECRTDDLEVPERLAAIDDPDSHRLLDAERGPVAQHGA